METKFRMNLIVGKFEPQNVDNSIRMQNAQQNIRPSLIVTLKIHDLNEESILSLMSFHRMQRSQLPA